MRARIVLIASLSLLLLPRAWAQRGGSVNPPKLGTIRGQIRLADGHPAPLGIPVYLEKRGGGTASQSQTDRQGKFEFPQLEPDIYIVKVHAQGYLDLSEEENLNMMPMAYVTFTLTADPGYKNPFATAAPGGVISAESLNAPEGARKNLESGKALLTKGTDYKTSIQLFKKAIKAYPKYSEAYLMMGLAYRAENNYDEAGSALKKCVEINPNSGPAYTALGEVQNQKQEYADAEKSLLKALALNPDSPQGHVELARTYWAQKRYTEAEPHILKALTLAPDNAYAHLMMGNVDMHNRNGQAALQEFQQYLKLDPQGTMAPSVRDFVAKLQHALGQTEPQSKSQ